MSIPNVNQVIVLDTNVLLNIYRYSPEFSEFALECLKAVSGGIILPATVRIEYKNHNRTCFSAMEKRFAEIGKETEKQISVAKIKILNSCANLTRLQYPDVEELKASLGENLDAVQKTLDDYFDDHASLELIQRSWEGKDYLEQLVDAMTIMPSPEQEEIYKWCEEGEKRYKDQVPPGFMDGKNKDGVRKYSDLIIWKEILNYARNQEKDIVFVTDDVKADWWDEAGFHAKLLAEFEKTGRRITPMKSMELLSLIATEYHIEKSDAVEIALRMTDKDYCEKIHERVFNEAVDELFYDATKYINIDTATIGTEGIDEFEIVDYELLRTERVERDNSRIVYEFTYEVTLEGTSFDYWGRDDDTGNVIRSDGRDHKFEGTVVVEVRREAEAFYDFEDDDSFETAIIISGALEETYASDKPEDPGELGYCPQCSRPLNIENDAGNGFCVSCSQKYNWI